MTHRIKIKISESWSPGPAILAALTIFGPILLIYMMIGLLGLQSHTSVQQKFKLKTFMKTYREVPEVKERQEENENEEEAEGDN